MQQTEAESVVYNLHDWYLRCCYQTENFDQQINLTRTCFNICIGKSPGEYNWNYYLGTLPT